MFARMTVLQLRPETIDEAIELFRLSVIPEAKKQEGYRGACLLIDRSLGKGKAVTFWNRERDALANEANLYYQEQLIKFLNMFAAPPSREGYEVVVHEIGSPAKKKPRKRSTGAKPKARSKRAR